MEQGNGFKEVRDALEIATRIDAMKKYVFEHKKDLQTHVGALTTVRVEDALEYARLERLSTILWHLTRDLDDPKWKPGVCYGEIHTHLW